MHKYALHPYESNSIVISAIHLQKLKILTSTSGQFIISISKSLVKVLLSLPVHVIIMCAHIYFAEKMRRAFGIQKLLTFLQQKIPMFMCVVCLKI